MTYSILKEHAGYLADGPKLAAYEQALAAHIADGAEVVLDLGTGSGILGLLAAKAGARRVYAVDSGPIVGSAAEVAARSGFGDVFVPIRGHSTAIDLEERVDVAVCDQIGGFVYDAGVLEYFADARRRLLRRGGALVPARFRLFVAPVEHDDLRRHLRVWASSPSGLDYSPFVELVVNTEHRVGPEAIRLLAPGTEIAAFAADHIDPIKGSAQCVVNDTGRLDGFIGWFEADLGGGATLTNRPDAPDRMNRWCNVYPFGAGTELKPGDGVEVSVDIRPALGSVTWRTTVRPDDNERPEVSERHSTLLGDFLDGEELARARGAPLELGPLGRAVARALELTDGSRSRREILDQVASDVPEVSSPTAKQSLTRYLDGLSTT